MSRQALAWAQSSYLTDFELAGLILDRLYCNHADTDRKKPTSMAEGSKESPKSWIQLSSKGENQVRAMKKTGEWMNARMPDALWQIVFPSLFLLQLNQFGAVFTSEWGPTLSLNVLINMQLS